MQAIRHLLAQRHLAVLVCAAALLLKLLVPTGCMIATDHGRIVMTVCSGVARTAPIRDMAGMHAGMADHGASEDHGKPKDHGRADMPCAFSGLSSPALRAIDPVQLAALIAFVLAIGLAATTLPLPAVPARLRPPLRGPPAYL